MIKRKILIVDDIEDNILLIEDYLKSELNCEFQRALSGRDALEILKNYSIHFKIHIRLLYLMLRKIFKDTVKLLKLRQEGHMNLI